MTERSSTYIQRAHLLLPVFDDEQKLVHDITVILFDRDGSTAQPEAWSGPLSTDLPVEWPLTFTSGVVDLWLTEPGRYTVQCTNSGRQFSAVFTGVDVTVGAELAVTVPTGDGRWWIRGVKEPGSWLQAPLNNPDLVRWIAPPLIAPHQHSGTQPGSTILNGGTTVDQAVDQTWLGYQSGSSIFGSDTTALGFQAQPQAPNTVIVGPASVASGASGTVIGPGSEGDQAGVVVLGGDHVPGENEISATLDSGANENFLVTTSTVTLRRGASVSPSTIIIGSSESVPASLPNGASSPVWVLGSSNEVDGSLKTLGSSTVGNSDSSVGFYGNSGSVKQVIDTGSTQGALHSLLSALRNYGLV